MNVNEKSTGFRASAVVIGGGIIGVTSALNLQKRGFDVTLVEKDAIAAGASTGNCGLVAVSEIVPIAKPGVLSDILKWLVDPEGPVAIRPLYAMTMLPWFMRFMKAAKKGNVVGIAHSLGALSNHATSAYEPILKESGVEYLLKPHEVMYLFDDKNEIGHDQFSWDLRNQCGFETEYLTGDTLREMEPEVSKDIDCAMLMKGWDYFSDPKRLTERLASTFNERGGKTVFGEVKSFSMDGNKIKSVVLSSGDLLTADEYVMATGAWSCKLAKQLGDDVPVEAMAGYNTTIQSPNVSIKHPLLYHNGGFVLTPMEMGLRVGGTLELGGLNSKPNFNRVRAITRKAKHVLPRLEVQEKTEWVGYRPMMPDTLPVIGRSPKVPNMTYACGHGQLGITYGAITGELVAEILTNQTQNTIDLSPYRVDRFKEKR